MSYFLCFFLKCFLCLTALLIEQCWLDLICIDPKHSVNSNFVKTNCHVRGIDLTKITHTAAKPKDLFLLVLKWSQHHCRYHSNYYSATTSNWRCQNLNRWEIITQISDEKSLGYIREWHHSWHVQSGRHIICYCKREEKCFLPQRINSQPGADENQSKHHKQNVAQSPTLAVVGHFSSLRTQTCFIIYNILSLAFDGWMVWIKLTKSF